MSASQALELALDNLTSVTADGRVLHASEDDSADLFWVVRGGGNFGVAASFEFVSIQSDR